jgi:GH24 family phage-related lysozyme (muramidase)
MPWQGGFAGDSYDRPQFRAWLRQQKKPIFSQFITIHNTGAPYTLASVGGKQRMVNLGRYYKVEKVWKGGPHFFVMEDRVYPGTPVHLPTVHSPSWNNISIAVECEGDYDGTHSPIQGKGAVAWDTMAWVVAEMLEWMEWAADDKHLRLHRQDKATTHACPGALVTLPWFIERVRQAGAPKPKSAIILPVTPPVTPPSVPIKKKVYEPGACRWSEDWAIPMMKKIEALRLKAYPDGPGLWSIGYGHNSSSGIAPKPYEGMVLFNEAAADALLRVDLNECLRYINTWVKVPLEQGMVDALCMFIFQQGPTNFKKYLLPAINAKMHWTAAKLIETKAHAKPGVMRRRALEAKRYRGEFPTKW